MRDSSLSLVVTCGERAVCHAVDPAIPAGELVRELALYFSPSVPLAAQLLWRSEGGPRPLDLGAPIGAQVPPEAEIDLPTIAL